MDAGGVCLAGVSGDFDKCRSDGFGFTGRAVSDLMPCGAFLPKERGFEVFGQFGSCNLVEVRDSALGVSFGANAPNTAMGLVTVWVGGWQFVVGNDFVIPVGDVEAAVRAELDVDLLASTGLLRTK